MTPGLIGRKFFSTQARAVNFGLTLLLLENCFRLSIYTFFCLHLFSAAIIVEKESALVKKHSASMLHSSFSYFRPDCVFLMLENISMKLKYKNSKIVAERK